MPLDSAGTYRMNPQASRAMDPMNAPAPMPGESQPAKTITITEKPDGTYSCTGPDGVSVDHGSLDEALAYVKQDFGGGEAEGPTEGAEDSSHGEEAGA